MRTAILTAPLTIAIEERPAPEPDPGEVLVAVRRSGVCGTDVHAFLGRLGSAGRVLGHDFVGEIRAIGAGVDGRTVGERVTVEPARVCGKCPPCRAGAPNVCERKQFMGVDIDGCFQDLLVAPAGSIRPLPDELSDDEATVLEPVAVALHVFGECLPLRRGNETVVLIGAGPIGLVAQQYAARLGHRTVAVDIVPERLTLASALGADVAVNGADPHAAEQIRDACGDRPNIVIESGGTEPSTRLALASASWTGDVVLVTVPPEPMPLVPVLLREIRLSGARGGYGHYPESIELVRSGQIDVARLVTHHYPLDRLGQALEDVRARPGEIVRAAIIH